MRLLPTLCPFCKSTTGNVALCNPCREQFQAARLPLSHIVSCDLRPYGIGRIYGICRYDSPVGNWLRSAKFQHDLPAGIALQKLCQELVLPDLPGDTVFVPVPLPRARLAARGFNQSALYARGLANGHGASMWPDVLADSFWRPHLAGTQGADARLQVRHSLRMLPAYRHRGPENVVLVDDILTTGATLARAATVLQHHWPSTRISAAVLAVTPAPVATA